MDVAVIGAGIAGLAVAAGLARCDVDVRVYEQSGDFDELGAGIQISPNGSRLLHRLGLGPLLERCSVRPQAIEMRRWDSGALIAATNLGEECTAMYGAPYCTMRRHDLHHGLLSLVRDAVRPARRCVEVNDRGPRAEMRFDDGTRSEADLVLGADGIHSTARAAVTGQRAQPANLNVYRGLVPDRYWSGPPRVEIWLGPGQHCVTYPVPGWVSFVAGTTREITGPAGVEDVLDSYHGWHPRLRGLLGAADWVTGWSLREGPALSRWSRGRVALIGDAAHAMLPVGAQGATQAIEDAAALAAAIRVTRGDAPAALARYESVRLPRLDAVAAMVRAHAGEHHLPDGQRQRERDATLVGRQRLAAQSWLYGYDAERAVLS